MRSNRETIVTGDKKHPWLNEAVLRVLGEIFGVGAFVQHTSGESCSVEKRAYHAGRLSAYHDILAMHIEDGGKFTDEFHAKSLPSASRTNFDSPAFG